MITVLDETDQVSRDFLDLLLASLKKDNLVSFLPTTNANSLPFNKLWILIYLHFMF